jgi:hypothetical protein
MVLWRWCDGDWSGGVKEVERGLGMRSGMRYDRRTHARAMRHVCGVCVADVRHSNLDQVSTKLR